jgi:hypothetical protein
VDDFIEVRFNGVVGMKVKTVYGPLTIAAADSTQADEILKFFGIRESQFPRIHCVALESKSGDGIVACQVVAEGLHELFADHLFETGQLQ